jgi:hypothetical protein
MQFISWDYLDLFLLSAIACDSPPMAAWRRLKNQSGGEDENINNC